ncbi:putative metal-binding motif-containing protein, partial [Aestuariivivens sediminis]|uniref:putative metal-binding motif-containing protein n=1 Tax=Aestuariivivens sediminis TaxID=2913557 RepID=UPI0023EEA31D
MNKITCFLLILLSVWSHAQNCDSNMKNGTYMAINSGDIEQVTNTIYAGEYQTVTNVLEEEYTFTSSYLGSTDFITIRNADGTTVLAEGDTPLTYTFQSGDIPTGEIRVIIHLSDNCDGDSNTHTVTLIKVPTCYKPEDPRVSYLSNVRLDFNWTAPGSGPAPVDYEWEIGLSGFTPGTGTHVVNGSTGGAHSATSGENALMASTTYQVAIRSDCGSGDFSNWLVTPNITTLAGDPPDNDLCDGALLVVQETNTDTVNAALRAGSVVNGAETNFEGENCDGGDTDNARDDVWYAFIAQTTDIHIELLPDFNGILTLFSGDCGSLIDEACSDDNKTLAPRDESIYFSSLVVGDTYYFRVYSQGFSTSTPDFEYKLWSGQSITDGDGDGYSTAGGDCNDANNTVYPGAPELCDGLDNDCDGVTPSNEIDADNDGFSECEGDCNDTDNTIYPFAPELCDGKDNDCANGIDDGLVFEDYYTDADGDGYGDASDTPESSCKAVSGKVTNNLDCDDGNGAINPDATEEAGNDVDENCDGAYLRYVDADGDGFGSTTTVSSLTTTPDVGESNNNADCDDSNAAINPDATEEAGNDVDENCDGAYLRYVDADGDGFGSTTTVSSLTSTPGANESNTNTDCDDTNAAINPDATEEAGNDVDENCDGAYLRYVDADGDGFGSTTTVSSLTTTPDVGESNNNADCDDGNAAINPDATEEAGNDLDENCDSAYLRYVDADGDGFGSTTTVSSLTSTPGANESNTNSDCDDTNAAINPDATEVAGNDVDENCDSAYLRYVDADGDGFGSTTTVSSLTSTPGANESNSNTDCDDTDNTVYPGAPELCDGKDNDCANGIDDGLVFEDYYTDVDGDGYGDILDTPESACQAVSGKVTNNLDCDDTDANEYPGQVWYADVDGDGYGSGSSQTTCERPLNHYIASELTATTGDCNDNDAAIHPGATEVCDGIDNNCNGQTDEGVKTTYYADSDGDGYGNPASTTQACSPPSGYVSNNTDCDDTDANEYPGQVWYADVDGDGYGSGSSQTTCERPLNHYIASELTATT